MHLNQNGKYDRTIIEETTTDIFAGIFYETDRRTVQPMDGDNFEQETCLQKLNRMRTSWSRVVDAWT
jgi:hypothetical protein